MSRETFDIAVIGGGIVGAGVALDAAARGLSVALVEKKDFASGTSSRSSKLIHGGLRYLQHGQIGLVRESLRERAVLNRIAPHLCKPTPFLLPVYGGGKPSPLGGSRLKLGFGLWLYDRFAATAGFPKHRWISAKESLQMSPRLDAEELRGAFVYHDCVTDDARLVIEIIKHAAARGAVIANYAMVDGNFSVRDSLEGRSFDLRAQLVVNATGIWTAQLAKNTKLRASKGIHVVLPADKFPSDTAVLISSLDGKRFHFVIPWQGRTLVGTTDTEYRGDLNEPRAEENEVRDVVAAVARSFPQAGISESDVIGSFAGLRPLAARGDKPSADLSRSEEIVVDESGMISVFGGKLTTYRAMAERVVDLAAKKLGREALPCTTQNISLTADARETEVSRIAAQSADLRLGLVEGLPHIAAEVVYAARHEMAITVEDVLERRTRIAILATEGGKACRELVERLLQKEKLK